jgi:uncharacterized protein (TIGR03089 family)
MDPRTFPDLLAARLSRDPGQPLVTAYDEHSGERTELSVTTYANWVAKTANLLADEIGLDEGGTVLLDLPSHWLVPVFLGAAWSTGLAVTTDTATPHDLVVCGPDNLEAHAGSGEVLACSLLPFAVRFPDTLPAGVRDYGLEWPGQPDVQLAAVAASPDTPAWRSGDALQSQAELIALARGRAGDGVRLISDVHPARDRGVTAWLTPLVAGGSLVLVQRPLDGEWPARHEGERATAVLREDAGAG